jgi:hypothetical protein
VSALNDNRVRCDENRLERHADKARVGAVFLQVLEFAL